MLDTARLLDLIEEGVVRHGGDLGGWTRRTESSLQLFDGRVTLRASLSDQKQRREGTIHVHVQATLHDHDDEVLDACLIGIGNDREVALSEAALIWITCVAGPIRSFVDGKPVCTTCQAGVDGGDSSKGYSPSDYGLPGLRAFVGPYITRWLDGEQIQTAFDDTMPWFRFAGESAAPRRVHLAKSVISSDGKSGWCRRLEIDGHDVSHVDQDWPVAIESPEIGYVTRFAVFEFESDSLEMLRRAELERTINYFAEHFSQHCSVDDLMDEMISQGFDADLVHETESISTIAFSRTLFEPQGVQYPSTVIRARRNGSVETDVPLMSLPAYSRARALAVPLRQTLPKDDFQSLCLYNAESQAILNAVNDTEGDLDLTQMKLYPSVVPDRGVSDQTMDAAIATLSNLVEQGRAAKRRPWWRFW